MISNRCVAIVGMGNVGTAAAHALFLERAVTDLLLVDTNHRRAEGEAMDLMHAQVAVGRTRVRAAGLEELGQAQIVVICAGVNQKPGETRLDLLARNSAIFGELAASLDRFAPEALVMIATNPVDVLTYAFRRMSRRPEHLVFGTGTSLDTARFRALLGDYYGVDPKSVHAYIVGEHGDSEVPLWSSAHIGGVPLQTGLIRGKGFDADAMTGLFLQVRDAAKAIIDRKGYTNLAIGTVISQLVRKIFSGSRAVMPLSVELHGEYDLEDVALSVPCVLGQHGVEDRVLPHLDDTEQRSLAMSAEVLRTSCRALPISG